MSTANGNGHARRIERGAARRRKRTKSQRAAIAAEILAGRRDYRPNRRELAAIFGTGIGMIDRARRLSPGQRERVISGQVPLGHFNLCPARLPASRNGNGASRGRGPARYMSDAELWGDESVVSEAAE